MRFGSTAKVLLKCKLKYYRISECGPISDVDRLLCIRMYMWAFFCVIAIDMLQVASAGAQAFLRAGSGAFVSDKLSLFRNRPQKPIQLYEFEGCPFCRKVCNFLPAGTACMAAIIGNTAANAQLQDMHCPKLLLKQAELHHQNLQPSIVHRNFCQMCLAGPNESDSLKPQHLAEASPIHRLHIVAYLGTYALLEVAHPMLQV